MSRTAASFRVGMLLILLWGDSGHARELWNSGEAELTLDSQIRLIGLTSRGTSSAALNAPFAENPTECGVFPTFAYAGFINCPGWNAVNQERVGLGYARLRLELAGRANENWSAFIAVDNQIEAGVFDDFSASLSQGISTSTLVDASGQITGENYLYRYSLYRGYLRFESRYFEAVIGRQRIPWGVGRLWNPIDRFNAIAPLQIQGESPGVDAVNLSVLFSDSLQLQAVFAPGANSSDHDYAGRLQGFIGTLDFGLMAGVFDEAPTVGIDLATNLGGAAGRAEVIYTHPERNIWPTEASNSYTLPDFWQVIVSLDYNVDWGNGLYLLAEHLYNGNALGFGAGRAGPLLPLYQQTGGNPLLGEAPVGLVTPDRFGGSRVITLSSQLTGLQAGYDITPELKLSMVMIYDWDGESAMFYPSITYSPLSWLEMTLAVQGTAGQKLSEYGDRPTTGFLLSNLYF
ncbi:MAG: hypothetical protein CL917_07555 [Deltaproteobacteria bacterium]|nr:hypothetical protein [Deltaproteobacteria bacterium]